MCDDIYIGINKQTLKKRTGGHFSDLLRLLKNIQISDSFAAHFEQKFESNTPCTDLRKGVLFRVINHINPIFEMKKITKPNCNLCTEERLTTIKIYVKKCVTIMNKIWRHTGPASTKQLSADFPKH